MDFKYVVIGAERCFTALGNFAIAGVALRRTELAARDLKNRCGDLVLGDYGVRGYFSTWTVRDFLHSQYDHVRHEDALSAWSAELCNRYIRDILYGYPTDIAADIQHNMHLLRQVANQRGYQSDPVAPREYVCDLFCSSSGRRYFGGDGPDYSPGEQLRYEDDERARIVEAQEQAQREAELEQPVVPWFT